MEGITPAQLENAVTAYVENEIVSHFTDWRKWAFAAVAALSVGKYGALVAQLVETPFFKALEVVTDGGLINDVKLTCAFQKAAQETGSIVQSLPIIGETEFTADDIKVFSKYIEEAKKDATLHRKTNEADI